MDSLRGLPHFAKGPVIKGFGRGSKELGIPTANFDEEVVNTLPANIKPGIYFGYANVDNGEVHKMVMSIGWNPFYNNTKRSMETYIIHEFEQDFYGKLLKTVLLGYIRPEKNFANREQLIEAINEDIAYSKSELDKCEFKCFETHEYFLN